MRYTMRRAAAISLGAALALGTSAFSAAAQDDKVLAVVDGVPVTQADVALTENDLDQQFSQLPPEQRQAAALSALIEIKLLAAQAAKNGVDKEPETMRRLELLRLRALHGAVIDREVASKIDDAAIKARYEQEIAGMPPVNEVRARHILVKTREEADAIIKEIAAGGNFEEIAKAKSTDGAASQGGDLGWFGPGQMVPEFETAAFALAVGAVSGVPVQTQFGFHVIKVDEKRARPAPPIDQVKDQIRSVLLREGYFSLVKSLRSAAKIEISDPALKAAVDAIDKPQDAKADQPAAAGAPAPAAEAAPARAGEAAPAGEAAQP